LSYLEREKVGAELTAFLLAGLSAATIGAAIFTTWLMIESSGRLASPFGLFVLALIVALIVCFVAGVFVGLPATWLFGILHLESFPVYLLTGLIAGTVCASPIFVGTVLPREPPELLAMICLGGLPGTVAGSIWWFKIRRNASRMEHE
jgi:hypothetical protein